MRFRFVRFVFPLSPLFLIARSRRACYTKLCAVKKSPCDEDKWFFVMFAKVFKFPFASSSEHAERQKERGVGLPYKAHTRRALCSFGD
jgi:hypothetical protein